MTEKEALVLLNMIEGVGPRTVLAIKKTYECVSDVFGADAAQMTQSAAIKPDVARKICEAPMAIDLSKELQTVQEQGIRVVTLWDEDYPAVLREIYDPPPVLYIKGHYDFLRVSIAVVGSRSATQYGRRTAHDLSYQLASRGITVVSGLARGIDTHAHLGALRASGATVAVLGCGMKRLYPFENRRLSEQIIRDGCVVSEFSCEVPPLGGNFPRRNRIISGLSGGVLVVEAAHKSGSLITADYAMEQGKPVFAVPGPIDSPYARGTLSLIRDGARMVQDVRDVLEELGLADASAAGAPAACAVSGESLNTAERNLFDRIGSEPVTIDQLSLDTGTSAAKVLKLLLDLELKRLIKQLPGKYFVKTGGLF